MGSKVSFSNPRLYAKFEAWPLGFKKEGKCTFQIEHNSNKGWRVIKTTTGKPKLSTYGGRCCIVDGSDGKTYIIQKSLHSAAITVYSHDFKTPSPESLGFDHYVSRLSDYTYSDNNDPFWVLAKLIHKAHQVVAEEVTDHGTLVAFDSSRIQGENK